jgi:hypothetical protein
MLAALFEGHEVATRVDGDWLRFPGRSGRVQGLIFDLPDVHPLCSTQVDIRFSPWPGCLIGESFSGFAETRDERVKQSVDAFTQNTLHVLLRVFFAIDCGEQTNEWTFSGQHGLCQVTDGNVLCRGPAEAPMGDGWLDGLKRILESHPVSDGTHWCRLYFAQLHRKPTMIELLLDNQPWKNAALAAKSLPWRLSDGFSSLRLFFVVQRGVDIGRGIGLIAENPDADEDRLESIMADTGIGVIDARRIVRLAPMAFARKLLQNTGMKFPTVGQVMTDQTTATIDLTTSPVYQRACEIADSVYTQGTMTSDELLAIAGRDATFKAANDALNAGHDIRNSAASFCILWNELEPLCPPVCSTSVSTMKPWWKIW